MKVVIHRIGKDAPGLRTIYLLQPTITYNMLGV